MLGWRSGINHLLQSLSGALPDHTPANNAARGAVNGRGEVNALFSRPDEAEHLIEFVIVLLPDYPIAHPWLIVWYDLRSGLAQVG